MGVIFRIIFKWTEKYATLLGGSPAHKYSYLSYSGQLQTSYSCKLMDDTSAGFSRNEEYAFLQRLGSSQ